MTSGFILGIGLGFHNHAPEQGAIALAFDQTATDQVRANQICRTAEKGVGQGWEILGDGLSRYGSGLGLDFS